MIHSSLSPSQQRIVEAMERLKSQFREKYLPSRRKRHPRASMPPRLVRRHKRQKGIVLRELL